jgi:hypothetical protein
LSCCTVGGFSRRAQLHVIIFRGKRNAIIPLTLSVCREVYKTYSVCLFASYVDVVLLTIERTLKKKIEGFSSFIFTKLWFKISALR